MLFCSASLFAQVHVDVFIIDSYITPELPHKFVLSFFTTENVTSRLVLGGEYEFEVSKEFNEDHKIEIDITGMNFDSSWVEYYITGKTENDENYKSEIFYISLPNKYQLRSERNTNLLTVCCLGGVIFGLPSPALVFKDGQNYLSLSKEIPVLSFYSTGYNYPAGYISLEYSHIIEAEKSNYLRLGYKHIWSIPSLEYISAGINGFTNFSGSNGLSPEITVGLFKLYNIFTFYSRYRFSFQPSNSDINFHEVSVGLYSNFFSINF